MPLYTYFCRRCSRGFEMMQSLAEHERGLPQCPSCSGRDVESRPAPFFAQTSRKA